MEEARMGGSAWGDFDNDGDLDIIDTGIVGGNRQIRVFKNNGDGTFDPNEDVIDGSNDGLRGDVDWGDFDNDGDLDILVGGWDNALVEELRVYRNNGDGTFDNTQIDVDGVNGGLSQGSVAWGDFDGDSDLDILVVGVDSGNANRLRVYRNNGNGTFDDNEIKIDNLAGLPRKGEANWGDFDNDGDLDIVAMGDVANNELIIIYINNGDGTISDDEIKVVPSSEGLTDGGVVWGDYDGDGDLDLLVSGNKDLVEQIWVFKNYSVERGNANADPTAPGTLNSEFNFSATGISTAAFLWIDGGDAETPTGVLNYDIQIATNSDFRKPFVVPGLATGTAMFSNYLRMSTASFGVGDRHYMYLKSTEPWTVSVATAAYGLHTDTTYYFRVFTVDSGLAMSGPSSNGTLSSHVAPNAITDLSSTTLTAVREINLTWTAPGDDENKGDLNSAVRFASSCFCVGLVARSGEGDVGRTIAGSGRHRHIAVKLQSSSIDNDRSSRTRFNDGQIALNDKSVRGRNGISDIYTIT